MNEQAVLPHLERAPGAEWAFQRYEVIRPDLPDAEFPEHSIRAGSLADIAPHVDAFVLDAYGVLNTGDTAVRGAVARMSDLQAMGKQLIVLTNGASITHDQAVAKYRRYGFEFTEENVVASREVALAGLPLLGPGQVWASIARRSDGFQDCPELVEDLLADDSLFDRAGGFLFLSSNAWNSDLNNRLIAALKANPRPFIIANPDLVAPDEAGLTMEPGHFAHAVYEATGIKPRYFGKPHGNAFAAALYRLPGIPRNRIAMVGDTLHTDILGGAAAGLRTVLITDHGLFRGCDVDDYIARSGIRPDWICPTT